MPTSKTFPNGLTVTSSANSPDSIEAIFRNVVAQILGYPVVDAQGKPLPPGSPAWNNVRVGWQQAGQPAWDIDLDVCIITATSTPHPFSEVNDGLYDPNDEVSLKLNKAYTQVWKIKFVFYGPNCFTNAAFTIEAMSLDWVHNALASRSIYAVTKWNRPAYVPELFEGRWWKRADAELSFNELVTISAVVPLAASVEITLVKENNLSRTVTVPI